MRHVLSLLLLLSACAEEALHEPPVEDTDVEAVDTDSDTDVDTDTDTDTDVDTDTDTDSDTDTDTDTEAPDPAEAMCGEWGSRTALTSEGTWSGDVESCDPGTLSDDGIDAVLAAVNARRWLAGQPEVTDSADRNADAQACSLMMRANNRLSHDPPESWACYTEQGADAAGKSNISTGQGLLSIDMYMVDFGEGNQPSLGHRRWILNDKLGPIGIGGTDRHSCLHVIGGSGSSDRAWTAWPPDGLVPLEVFEPVFGWTLDQTGWSIQSESIDLSTATVTVTRDGETLPVQTRTLLPWYGSRHALAFRPDGWTTTPGTYEIDVSGISAPFRYDVEVVDCDGL